MSIEEASKAAEHIGLCHFAETSAAESFEAVDSVFRQLFRLTKASSQAIKAATIEQLSDYKTLSNPGRRRKSLTQLKERFFDYHGKSSIFSDVSHYRKRPRNIFKSKSHSYLKSKSSTLPTKCQSLCTLTEYPELTTYDTYDTCQRVQTMPKYLNNEIFATAVGTRVVRDDSWTLKRESKLSFFPASTAVLESNRDEANSITENTSITTKDIHKSYFLPKFPVLPKKIVNQNNENDLKEKDDILNNNQSNKKSKTNIYNLETNSEMTLSGDEKCENMQIYNNKSYYNSCNNFSDSNYQTEHFLKLLKDAISIRKSKKSKNKKTASKTSNDETTKDNKISLNKKFYNVVLPSLLSKHYMKKNKKTSSLQDSVSEIVCMNKNLSIM